MLAIRMTVVPITHLIGTTVVQVLKVHYQHKNIKMSSFKSSENIQKKEGGPDRSVSDNQSSSVTLNELAMKAIKNTVISSFSEEVVR